MQIALKHHGPIC